MVENPDIRSSIKTVLKSAGHRLIACDSCMQAQLLMSPIAERDVDSSNAAASAEDNNLSKDIPEDMPAPPYLAELENGNFFPAASPNMKMILDTQEASCGNRSPNAWKFSISCDASPYKFHRHHLTARTLRVETRHSLESAHIGAMLTG
jgi:hypothetical protein